MARLPRYAIPGQPQHVIQRGNNRQAIFARDTDYQFFRDALIEASGKYGQAILAATNVSISLILIPYFGLMGSAFGLLAATTYNAMAIFNRGKHNLGTLDKVGSTLNRTWLRYALSILLFIAAIQVGITSGSILFSLLLMFGLAVIMFKEPLVGFLLLKMGL